MSAGDARHSRLHETPFQADPSTSGVKNKDWSRVFDSNGGEAKSLLPCCQNHKDTLMVQEPYGIDVPLFGDKKTFH